MLSNLPARADRARGRLLRVHGTIARDIGSAIVSGELPPGMILDTEIEASAQRHVSRAAYREAMRILGAKGLVTSRPRHGTRVNDMAGWHLLDPDVLSWMFSGIPKPEVLHGLFELRTLIEPPAAALAAQRRSRAHLTAMRRALVEMEVHTLREPEGRAADGEFHAALLDATANAFVISLTNGVIAAVDALTQFKQRLHRIDRDPVPDHRRVYEAIAAKDAEAARQAMGDLINLAVLDLPERQRPSRLLSKKGITT
jgi:DNA-binding FadR family transcriptional regulator